MSESSPTQVLVVNRDSDCENKDQTGQRMEETGGSSAMYPSLPPLATAELLPSLPKPRALAPSIAPTATLADPQTMLAVLGNLPSQLAAPPPPRLANVSFEAVLEFQADLVKYKRVNVRVVMPPLAALMEPEVSLYLADYLEVDLEHATDDDIWDKLFEATRPDEPEHPSEQR